MSFQLSFHPLVIPFVAAFIISLLLSAYAFRIRNNPIIRLFAWYAAAITVWQFTSVLELASVAAEAKYFWTSVKYLGAASAPVLGLLLALAATRKTHWLKRRWFTVPLWAWGIAAMLVVWTNPWHHWYWLNTWVEPNALEISTEKNWWFGIYAAGMYLTITASTVLYLSYVRTAPAIYRKQALWFAIGGFLPLFFRGISDFAGVEIIQGADQVVFLMLFTVIFYAVALLRYGAFRLIPVAYDQVVHDLDSPVMIFDKDGVVLDGNSAALNLFNTDLSAAIGKPIENLTGIADWAAHHQSEWWREQRNQHRCFQVTLSDLKDKNGSLLGHSLLLTDITQQKDAEAKLEAANREKQRMTADLAHDLRTPIQIVSGYLEALADGMMSPSSDRYQSMQRQMGNLGKLVTDIMVLAKSDAGELKLSREQFDLNVLVHQVVDDLQPVAETKAIQLQVRDFSEPAMVSADDTRIEQVLQNLLRNAITHTSENGQITVDVYPLDDTFEVAVTDSGIGLAPEHLNLVFDRAFRVSEARATEQGSNGLGLAICHSLITAHGGDIGVHSDGLGSGARFWFRLPISHWSH